MLLFMQKIFIFFIFFLLLLIFLNRLPSQERTYLKPMLKSLDSNKDYYDTQGMYCSSTSFFIIVARAQLCSYEVMIQMLNFY